VDTEESKRNQMVLVTYPLITYIGSKCSDSIRDIEDISIT